MDLTHLPQESYDTYILRVRENYLASSVKQADLKHNLSTSEDKHAKNKRIIWRLSLWILEHTTVRR